jgi:hypothetical protein
MHSSMVLEQTKKVLILSFGLFAACSGDTWQLPVRLGTTKADVHAQLGAPNEVIPAALRLLSPEAASDFEKRNPGVSNEYYYSSGLVCRFQDDNLFGITVNPRSDYKGWVVYDRPIINGIRVTDRVPTPALSVLLSFGWWDHYSLSIDTSSSLCRRVLV